MLHESICWQLYQCSELRSSSVAALEWQYNGGPLQARVYGGGGQLTMDSAREALRLADEGQDAVRRFTGI